MHENARQLYALGLCTFTVPAVLFLPRVGWLAAAIACCACALLILLMICLRRRCDAPMTALCARGWGRLVGVLVLAGNLVLLGASARYLCMAYPVNAPLTGLLLLLLACAAAQKRTLPRVGAIVFFFLVAFYLLLMGFSLPKIETEWLRPCAGVPLAALSCVLAPVGVFWLADGERCGKPLPWLLGGIVLGVLAALVTAGMLSPHVARRNHFPFYTAAKSVSILGAMERLEPLVSAALTAGGFCLLGTLCSADTLLVRAALPAWERGAPALNFLGGCVGFLLAPLCSECCIAVLTAIFWGAVPLALLCIGACRGKRKKAEISENNA